MAFVSFSGAVLLLLSTLCWERCAVVCDAPLIIIEDINPVRENTPTELTCVCSGSCSFFSWRGRIIPEDLNGSRTWSEVDDDPNVITRTVSVLPITFTRYDHRINYSCFAVWDVDGRPLSANITMQVQYSPTVSVRGDVVVDESGRGSHYQDVECTISGNPAPDRVSISTGGRVLASFLTSGDAGGAYRQIKTTAHFNFSQTSRPQFFKCSASSVTFPTWAHTYAYYENATWWNVLPLHVIEARPGDSVSIECGIPLANVAQSDKFGWFKENDATFSAQGRHLTLTDVTQSSQGLYYCKGGAWPTIGVHQLFVLNRLGRVRIEYLFNRTTPVEINQSRTYGAMVGDNIKLMAYVEPAVQPSVQFKWWFEGEFLDQQVSLNHFLDLTNIQESDAGRYEVEVENEMGRISGFVTIHVMRPGLRGLKPKRQIKLGYSDFQLSCSVQGRVVERFVWLKNGQVIEPGDFYQVMDENLLDFDGRVVRMRQKLRFRGSERTGKSLVANEDKGSYTCKLQNKGANSTTMLLVHNRGSVEGASVMSADAKIIILSVAVFIVIVALATLVSTIIKRRRAAKASNEHTEGSPGQEDTNQLGLRSFTGIGAEGQI